MPETVSRPIFLVGTGRSGTTMLNGIMVHHPRLAFVTRILNYAPAHFRLHRTLLRMADLVRWPWFIRTLEAPEPWAFWNHLVPSFSNPYRDLRATDVTDAMRRRLKGAFQQLLIPTRPRPWHKLTGWTRIGFLKEVFPDARIIHMIRDPRATVSSLINAWFWGGLRGPGRWRWGPLDQDEERIWKRHDESFVVLAAIQWRKILLAYSRSIELLPDAIKGDIMELRYGDFCECRDESIARILSFCELEESRRFRKAVSKLRVTSQDLKWKTDMTPHQQNQLETVIEELGLDQYYTR